MTYAVRGDPLFAFRSGQEILPAVFADLRTDACSSYQTSIYIDTIPRHGFIEFFIPG